MYGMLQQNLTAKDTLIVMKKNNKKTFSVLMQTLRDTT